MVAPGPDGRVLFTFGESLHTVVCAPLRVCDIELEAGEVIQGAPQLGDSVRWTVTAAATGEGAERREHVIVKPTLAGLETNLIIPTDRRMYHLLLVSGEAGFVSRIAFRYPDSEAKALAAQRAALNAERREVTADFEAFQTDRLNFEYDVEVQKGGRRVPFVPVRVFDDGQRTFVQMPPTLEVSETPALFVVGRDGKDQLVNFRVRNGFYVVDRLFDEAALVAGVGRHQERVRIERKRCRATWMNDCRSGGHGE
jgi:type IV secretion system protein VirB9